MKKILVVVFVMFSFALVSSVFSQAVPSKEDVSPSELGNAPTGAFSGQVVSVNPKDGTATIQTDKYGTREAKIGYAKTPTGYNAAKTLKPGDKVQGSWIKVENDIYITKINKMG